jgi:NADH-quinone oxidoreductase subunit E
MVSRRLADDSVQPPSFAFTADNAKWAEWKIGLYPAGRQQSAVIPLLMRAQDQDGWVTRATIESVAELLGMAYIRVLEVATFYTQFQLKPVGTRAHIQVCGTTPCMLRGAGELIEVCQHKIHHDPHTTNADGTMSWEEVECLGSCVNAPMVMIHHDTYEDLTAESFSAVIDAFAEGRGATVKPGTQIGRLNAAAEGGRTTLLEAPSVTREKFIPPAPPETPAVPAAAPVAASPAAAATAAPTASAGGAAPQAPTTAGRPRDVNEDNAPALKGPAPQAKVTEAKAEADRNAANAVRNADGEPNSAMRPDATGAESPAGKIDGGRAPGKAKRSGTGDGANAAGVSPQPDTAGTTGSVLVDTSRIDGTPSEDRPAAKASRRRKPAPDQLEPTRELGGDISNDDDKSE